jgi:hypothetical protein
MLRYIASTRQPGNSLKLETDLRDPLTAQQSLCCPKLRTKPAISFHQISAIAMNLAAADAVAATPRLQPASDTYRDWNQVLGPALTALV